jgi:uncharacterized protein YyaL (SSP411 family)
MNKLKLLLIIISFAACKSKNNNLMEKHKFTNNLINETSPYLLQHAHNPVNWYAWNEETLALAKKENKLLLISVGYAACHWCHVMEHETFEDEEAARIMNENYICIKVDREERPDVDQVYMDAVQLLTGSGGWPLNCVALPDGRPVWGGTYFPKNNFISALQQIAKVFKEEPEKIEKIANNLYNGIKQSGLVQLNKDKPIFTKSDLDKSILNWKQYMDFVNGGRTGAPKFPMPINYQFLLRYAIQADSKEVKDYVNLTLTKMSLGGINDQIGGGFARYSTDTRWHIPHFEKMLYDNGQLLSLYANAYKATKNDLYKETAYEISYFLERELMHPKGYFYSSLDADSLNKKGELEEGAYYVWTKEELQKLIKTDFDLFAKYYNINALGLWEDSKYHLIRTETDKEFSKNNNITVNELKYKVKKWKEILLKERNKRPKPGLDDKTLTSWNALTLKGYIDSYKAFGDSHFLNIALKNATFIEKIQIQPNGSLYRNFKNGKSTIPAYLEDYATVIDAFISLHEVTLNEKWLQIAKQLTNHTLDHFYDDSSGMFFFTSDLENDLITRKMDIDDNVIPSSNSIMANNLFKLGHYFNNKSFSKKSKIMLNNVKNKALSYPAGASNWMNLYSNYLGEFYEIAIVGKDAIKKSNQIQKKYIPNALFTGSLHKSNLPLLSNRFTTEKTLIYICRNGTCQLPKEKNSEAFKLIKINFKN